MTPPTVFSYTLVLNQVKVLSLGPYTTGAVVSTTLNPYTTISGTTLTIAPTLPSHVGSSVIKVQLTLSLYYTEYSFTITVPNTIINFLPSLKDQTVSSTSTGIYKLPGITNTASLPVTVTCTIPASFITYNSGT